MRILTKNIAFAFAAIGIAVASTAAMAAPATSNVALNVRTGPGTSFNVIDTLLPGEQVDVTECVSNGWCRIEHPGPDGWVSSNYLTPVTGGGSGGGSGSGGSGGSGSSSSSDPDCSFGITIGPGGPAISISCGDAPPPAAPPAPPPPAPPAPPPPAPPVAAKVCFYMGNNFSGTKACANNPFSRAVVTAAWNDRISSFKTYGGAKVKVCQGTNFSGLCDIYSSNVAVLNGALNNKISSYVVFTGALPVAPPPPPPSPTAGTTRSTGPIALPQTYLANLDNGNVGSAGADIWYEAVTAVNKFITPRNGAKLSISGPSNRGYAGCSAASYSNNKISIWAMPVGTYICVKTNMGRYSEFRLNGYTGTTMNLGYTTWNN